MKRGRRKYGYPMDMYPRRDYPSRHPRNKRKGGFFVILLVIAALIYIYVSKGGSILNLSNLANSTYFNGKTNNLIQACDQKVTACGSIIQSKYESNLTIIKTSELNTTLGASQFLKTWGPAGQNGDAGYYGIKFPAVMVAARMDNSDGTKTPHVFICNSDGTLNEKSILGLC